MIAATRRSAVLIFLPTILFLSLLSGCAPAAAGKSISPPVTTRAAPPATAAWTASPTPAAAAQAALDTRLASSATPAKPRLWISTALPEKFRQQLQIPAGLETAVDQGSANLRLEITADRATAGAWWVYALAAPFPTSLDEVSLAELQRAWKQGTSAAFQGKPLLMTAETRAVFQAAWGPASPRGVRVVAAADLLATAWKEQPAWAILPFEEIAPRWKVLRVDGQSPLEKTFEPSRYPLAAGIRLQGTAALAAPLLLPTNRNPNLLTVLVMTGTTALSRHIGERMESKGVSYPGLKIREWLAGADLTHISNEVSFKQDCPKPGPLRADMRFCSSPRYIGLLEDVGANIIELTGNHNLDWGFQPFLDSLEMYRQRGWKTYGGGETRADAQKPLLVEHNGNKIAFLGCSPAGPEAVWATNDEPGSAPCDFDRMEQQMSELRAQGYLPIVTLQAIESDQYVPVVAQGMPVFRQLARAGAVIVSGSQSHVPQTMTFVEDHFVHYGLGNLFFDQMDTIETRQEFIDRHVFYDGKYLGVELLTALLEDYSQPRPMTSWERDAFLNKIFSLSNWNGD